MYKLVILADDFTGALDTGVQLSKKGISTLVTTNTQTSFDNLDKDVQVLVIDMESRHLSPEEAYKHVFNITKKFLKIGVQYIYKKTDSALRGNIGSELAALVEATGGENILFIPAFPKTNRVTINGIHYIDGIPVSDTVFGRDPFEPVKHSNISDVIREQSNLKTYTVKRSEIEDFNYYDYENSIIIFDAESDQDLTNIAKKLKQINKTSLLAGCAGFAEQLPFILDMKSDDFEKFEFGKGIVIMSGSVNDITIKQINYAYKNGFQGVTLKPEEKLVPNILRYSEIKSLINTIEEIYKSTGKVIIDAAGSRKMVNDTNVFAKQIGLNETQVRLIIAENMGRIAKHIFDNDFDGTYVIFGGDSLKAIMDSIGFDSIVPLRNIDNGIVLSRVMGSDKSIYIISKSGGFGEVDSIVKIERFIEKFKKASDILCLKSV